jgi:hypothetical protein
VVRGELSVSIPVDKIESLKAKQAQSADLTRQLQMWAEAEAQGIDPEDVKAFTFRPEFLRNKDRVAQRKLQCFANDKNGTVYWFNAVRLKNGELKRLDPMIRKP